jgi:hypothetical protein
MDHSTATEERQRVEKRLAAEVEERRAAYVAAKAQARRLERYYADPGAGQQDGSYVRKAVGMQHLARIAYREALVKFDRFILDGKPDDKATDLELHASAE